MAEINIDQTGGKETHPRKIPLDTKRGKHMSKSLPCSPTANKPSKIYVVNKYR